jgi:hypothetical protein
MRLDGRRLVQAARDFFYGLTGYEFAQQAMRLRAELEDVFTLILFGDMVGLPILPPYYSLRLLPYMVPHIATWKKRILREKDVLESEELDLIEM